MRKVPILLIIGNQELEQGTVTVRRYGIEKQESLAKQDFVSQVLEEIRERRNTTEPLSSII